MARKGRIVTDDDLRVLSSAWGIINLQREEVKHVGAKRAAAAISRALKSLDGAIRHASLQLHRQDYEEKA
jgi:hypothetical protein